MLKTSRHKRSSSESPIVCQDEIQTIVEPLVEPIKSVFKVLKRSNISRSVISLNCGDGKPGDLTQPGNKAPLVLLLCRRWVPIRPKRDKTFQPLWLMNFSSTYAIVWRPSVLVNQHIEPNDGKDPRD